jgi:hypothetical protein
VNLYLDTEFDGHNGSLVSLALAAEDGKHWYGIFSNIATEPWVQENVHPKLYAMKPTVEGRWVVVRFSLKEYLLSRQASGVTIWADWPADFEHLMHLMCGDSYAESFMIPCSMQLIATPPGEPKPEIPHNALSDAIALRDWHCGAYRRVLADWAEKVASE